MTTIRDGKVYVGDVEVGRVADRETRKQILGLRLVHTVDRNNDEADVYFIGSAHLPFGRKF